jgi:hypothetical protein
MSTHPLSTDCGGSSHLPQYEHISMVIHRGKLECLERDNEFVLIEVLYPTVDNQNTELRMASLFVVDA